VVREGYELCGTHPIVAHVEKFQEVQQRVCTYCVRCAHIVFLRRMGPLRNPINREKFLALRSSSYVRVRQNL